LKNVLIFSGGRGSKSLIDSLYKLSLPLKINTIINLYDDGKSSGMVRSSFDMPGPSDARKVQEIFLRKKKVLPRYQERIFDLRISTSYLSFLKEINNFINFKDNNLFGVNIPNKVFKNKIRIYIKKFSSLLNNKFINTKDISLMNIVYVGAYFHHNKNINNSIKNISTLFKIKNKIVSCGYKNLYLSGINQNNKIFYSEEEIVEQRSNINMQDIFLTSNKLNKGLDNSANNSRRIQKIKKLHTIDKISKEAHSLISKADIIIYSPGTPYSSLYPSYIVKGVGLAISNNINAIKIIITNIGSDYETPKFKADDYIKNTIRFLNKDCKFKSESLITHCLINNPPSKKKYYVKPYLSNKYKNNLNILLSNFENKSMQGTHDPLKLAEILKSIII